ncbi:hypothetical protein Y032_0021g287 [Ancylostoma ceylanicum]|uniref:Uncharacterized protein n=1 Tax=Ancylostoma ceylanicum TaxID=53326 RepID=A0A016V1J9_9BILA|nr:hypothetical protein Y032_0021g287 [Ancylostoma ceylanicum]
MLANDHHQCWRPTIANVGDCCNGAYRFWDFAIGRRCWRFAVANVSDWRPPSPATANRGAILLEEYSGYLRWHFTSCAPRKTASA